MSSKPDYQQTLLETVLPKRKYKLSEVKDRIVKVAFDVVRFKDEDSLNLWKIETGNDGEYIVALYDEEDNNSKVITAAVKTKWSAAKHNDTITVSYASVPVVKLSAQELNMEAAELDLVASYLPKKLAENASLKTKLLSKISPEFRQNLTSQFPELNND